LGQQCLLNFEDPFKHIGVQITVEGEVFTVDEDMATAVKVYVEAINERAPLGSITEGHIKRGVEQRLVVNDLVWGTGDCILYTLRSKVLDVWDYKHGSGVLVSPVENIQMMNYALGAVKALQAEGCDVEKVNVFVCQPRTRGSEQIKNWETTPQFLFDWEEKTLNPGILATQDPNAPLCAGNWCKDGFCPARPTCPAQRQLAMTVAKQVLDPIHEQGTPQFPSPESLTRDELAKVLQYSEVLNDWVGQVAAYAKQQADIGMGPSGFKLVAKRANRAWIDGNNALFFLETILGEGAYKKSVLSPAQAEKALKAAGQDPSQVGSLVHKPDTGTTLVPVGDKRPAVGSSVTQCLLKEADFFS